MEALFLVAECSGPTTARIGIMRAINRGKPNPEVVGRRKPVKRYRLVL